MNDEEEVDKFSQVPEHMREWLTEMPTLNPHDNTDATQPMWDRFDDGRCMCCAGVLAGRTTVVVNPAGLAAVFCCGVCATDMANVGWLQESHDDIIDRIKFRGGIDQDQPLNPDA